MENIENKYSLTLEQIEKSLSEFFKYRENDDSEPDLVITATPTLFMASVRSDKLKINTGIGGLKQILKAGAFFTKVKYNDKILNQQEYEQLRQQILSK